MSAKRIQPPWTPHPILNEPVLKIYNSLTRQKEAFVPKNGKSVTWYSCGPTVYDASHMGHARSYITFDILRRTLSDYFGFDITYVMNITDIDDKIIKRARQNHLFEKYCSEQHCLDKVLQDAQKVIEMYKAKSKTETDPDKKTMMDNMLKKIQESLLEIEGAVKSQEEGVVIEKQQKFLADIKDSLSEYLDKQFGDQVVDNEIFATLPAFWESEFHKDMDSLNILRPSVLTRVSEYIPEIIEYIEKIIQNGLAYEANGSVYFDVASFDKRDVHHYAKLVPEAYGDANSLQEGEGDLSTTDQQNEKRSPTDFALWKKSKKGEPSWKSPWGLGRPGWHIECSAMASVICGPTLDIHTGGVDLKFPHHDNEIAQSEAYFNSSEWVKYFIHSGHLTIAGCKMSKSLKNFITIKDALEKYTSRQLRFAFLLHSWRDTLDYSSNTMEIALQYEKLFNEFFLNVKDVSRDILNKNTTNNTFAKWNRNELELNGAFVKCKQSVHGALCDNIDTRTALETMRDLVAAANVYIRDQKPPNELLLLDIAAYITKILGVFGAIGENTKLGFPIAASADVGDTESLVMPYLTILSEFRRNVRTNARELKAVDILKECDSLRDEILPNVGVRLEDREEGEPSAVKLVDRASLMREKALKKQQELEKEAERERKRQQTLEMIAAKEARMKIPPQEIFKMETDKYSRFDENGYPTHDVDGKEISKGQLKKLQKVYLQQSAKHQVYLDSLKK